MKKKNGFTLVELMVAMAIMVVAFGLVTYLYTRAAKIRKIVVVNNEVQQVLSQIMDTLTYGDKTHWGFSHSTGLDDSQVSETTAVYLKRDTETMEVIISDGKVNITWGSDTIDLDPNNKVEVITDPPYNSRFEYFDRRDNRLNPPISSPDTDKVSFIKITLWARSTDPSFKLAEPVPLVTGVKLGKKTSF
ncbi:MAG: prepilin-type N-terminal cleavage/methylation domain-containing protein [Candidatus Omnitrophica bacterium]|nr:prepilin-type N-terminal cleavage/methylation domain-containing protein [Candidatus Omnitrophota bacterium]